MQIGDNVTLLSLLECVFTSLITERGGVDLWGKSVLPAPHLESGIVSGSVKPQSAHFYVSSIDSAVFPTNLRSFSKGSLEVVSLVQKERGAERCRPR